MTGPDKDVTNIIVAKNRAGALRMFLSCLCQRSPSLRFHQGNNYSESEAAQYAGNGKPCTLIVFMCDKTSALLVLFASGIDIFMSNP